MLIGVIADDFTGASDIASILAKGLPGQGGLRVAQYPGIPAGPASGDIEAGVISLKSRSIPPSEAVAQSLAALHWLQKQGCRQFVFKYCSTFDSTPKGNIGPVAEALAEALGVKGIVACPAFPAVGRTVHQGHLFVHDRLLSESGMQNHPLTPMTDPDIRRWLSRQARTPVGLVPASIVRSGTNAVRQALTEAAGEGKTLVIADAATDDDLITLGRACAEDVLLTGGSGIAIGLPANFISRGEAHAGASSFAGIAGPGAVLAGSCSATTLKQIEIHAASHPALAVDVDAAMRNDVTAGDLVRFVEANLDRTPLVYSSATPDDVRRLQVKYGRDEVAHRLDGLFAETARRLVARSVKRLVVAGGETSGAVAQALQADELEIGPEIDPGVPVLLDSRAGIAMAFKSGNFGSPDFFAKALAVLEGRK